MKLSINGAMSAGMTLYLCFFMPVLLLAQTSPDKLLLKDYRPRSIYKVPVTDVQRAKFPIIDMHSHPYAKSPAEVDQWVRLMDEMGIKKTIILTKAYGAEFDSIYQIYAKYPDRFEVWCGLNYTGYDKADFGPGAAAELERCFKTGAKGVGELGDKGKGLFYSHPQAWGMHADDPRMDVIWDKCAELGMPVSIHVGEPEWFYEPMDSTNDGLMNALHWRLDNQPGILNLQEMVKTLENAVAKHPKTIFVACHLANCNHDLAMLGRLFDKYDNLYADIAARYAENAPIPRYTAKFLEKYQNKIVYGTDMEFNKAMYRITFRILETADEHFYAYDQFGYHWALYGLDLNDKVLKKLYNENALKIIK